MRSLLFLLIFMATGQLCTSQIIYHKFDPFYSSDTIYEAEGGTTKSLSPGIDHCSIHNNIANPFNSAIQFESKE